MSGVIIPDARGGLVWIHGSDGTATPVKVSVDASGHLQIDTLTWALRDALGNYQLGYYGQYSEIKSNLNPTAGDKWLVFTTVPAGYVQVVKCIWGRDDTTAKRISLEVVTTAGTHTLKHELEGAAGQVVTWDGEVVLVAGDWVQVKFVNVVAGDDLYAGVLGYQVKIA